VVHVDPLFELMTEYPEPPPIIRIVAPSGVIAADPVLLVPVSPDDVINDHVDPEFVLMSGATL